MNWCAGAAVLRVVCCWSGGRRRARRYREARAGTRAGPNACAERSDSRAARRSPPLWHCAPTRGEPTGDSTSGGRRGPSPPRRAPRANSRSPPDTARGSATAAVRIARRPARAAAPSERSFRRRPAARSTAQRSRGDSWTRRPSAAPPAARAAARPTSIWPPSAVARSSGE